MALDGPAIPPKSADWLQLSAYIKSLAQDGRLPSEFYACPDTREPAVCQGDVLQLNAPAVYLDTELAPTASEDVVAYWLMIGNTCDFTREREDVEWSQLVPIVGVPAPQVTKQALGDYRAYKHSRLFYLPPWSQEVADRLLLADFLRPVTVTRDAVLQGKQVVARMGRPGWVLLHSCIVRYLARYDTRFEEPTT